GFTQSGPSFHLKTRALEKNLQKAFPAGISLVYPTGPHRLSPADIPFPLPSQQQQQKEGGGGDEQQNEELEAYAWWRAQGNPNDPSSKMTYTGLEQGLATISHTLATQGPFDGVIGFSQGAACAAMITSLLEPGRAAAFSSHLSSAEKEEEEGIMPFPSSFSPENLQHPPLKFAALYSGFMARGGKKYEAFYHPRIATPTLHFLGMLDAVVEEARSLRLAERCEGTTTVKDGVVEVGVGGPDGKQQDKDDKYTSRVIYHPGGHFLPASQKAYVGALVGFIKEVLASHDDDDEGKKKKDKEEESVEDMDMPF
ncbi:hypothetical protein DM02DRAFT_614515, partial [Periconia macrospinosa]